MDNERKLQKLQELALQYRTTMPGVILHGWAQAVVRVVLVNDEGEETLPPGTSFTEDQKAVLRRAGSFVGVMPPSSQRASTTD